MISKVPLKKGGYRGMFNKSVENPMNPPLNLPFLGETSYRINESD
jgi:hypothetical protein